MTKKTRKSICHELKTWPQWYNLITRRMMEFQVRNADKDFMAGDTCHLREYDPLAKKYTGNSCTVKIILIIDDMVGVKPDYVAFAHRLVGGKPKVHDDGNNLKGIGE